VLGLSKNVFNLILMIGVPQDNIVKFLGFLDLGEQFERLHLLLQSKAAATKISQVFPLIVEPLLSVLNASRCDSFWSQEIRCHDSFDEFVY
jgi:hypothetical protein